MSIKQPKSVTSKKDTKTPFGAQIFSMPERYRHGADVQLKEPETPKKTHSQGVVPPPPPPKTPPKPPVKSPAKKKGRSTKILLIVGVIIIVLLIVGGYLLLQSVKPEEVVVETLPEEVVVETPPEEDPEEVPQEIPEEPTEEPPKADPFVTEVVRGVDSDSDGLTDAEEEYIYNTDPRLPDTDRDGFLDGNEVFHLYNPNGEATGGNTLLESGVVTVYTGLAHTVFYRFLYPTVWTVEQVDSELVIDSGRGEGVRVSYERKTSGLSVENWVEINVGMEDSIKDLTKQGLEVVFSKNTIYAYIDFGEAVLILQYDMGTKARVDYLQTFKMLINSIEIIGEQEAAEAMIQTDVDLEEPEISDSTSTLIETEESL
jgi:hypothetical protein